jgi:hypothetical protein
MGNSYAGNFGSWFTASLGITTLDYAGLQTAQALREKRLCMLACICVSTLRSCIRFRHNSHLKDLGRCCMWSRTQVRTVLKLSLPHCVYHQASCSSSRPSSYSGWCEVHLCWAPCLRRRQAASCTASMNLIASCLRCRDRCRTRIRGMWWQG